MTRVLVVFYSMTGRTAALAKAVASGAEEERATVRLRQVREHFSDSLIESRPELKKIREELKEIPVVAQEDIVWADAIALGSPTRYGTISGQLRSFVESLNGMSEEARFHEKVASVFTSTSPRFGGQACTLSIVIPLFYLGFILLGHENIEEKKILETFSESPLTAPVPRSPEQDEGLTDSDFGTAHAMGRRLAVAAARLKIHEAMTKAA